ncbi:MAG: YciI family protein [Sphingomonas taxi]
MVARPMAPLTLVLLTYVVPIEQVNAQRDAHVAWIEGAIDEGVMLLAGRKSTADGGVLLFRGKTDVVEAFARTDPYVTSGVATIEVIGFAASLTMDAVAELL